MQDVLEKLKYIIVGILPVMSKMIIDYRKNKKKDVREHELIFQKFDEFQIESIELRKEVSLIRTSLLVIQDNDKHESFTKSFIARTQIKSLDFIYSLVKENKELQIFLSSGIKKAISIFKNILNIGFEDVSEKMVYTWFQVADKQLTQEFTGKELALESNTVRKIIAIQRDVFMHNLHTLIKEKENGVRRAGFEKISNDFLTEIIKQIASI
ncbi:MAG: hypothetical protein DRI95_00625 [Bacteroidetes bacterium]|nr:MAG: hypothetical protein DRI95_00625 [Bacteroidota bacterium]